MVKNLPAMQETWVQSLGQEDPLEKEMATHSSILAWKTLDRGTWWTTVHWVAMEHISTIPTKRKSKNFKGKNTLQFGIFV